MTELSVCASLVGQQGGGSGGWRWLGWVASCKKPELAAEARVKQWWCSYDIGV